MLPQLHAKNEIIIQTVGASAPKKVKCVPLAEKIMATGFLKSSWCSVLIEYMGKSKIINRK